MTAVWRVCDGPTRTAGDRFSHPWSIPRGAYGLFLLDIPGVMSWGQNCWTCFRSGLEIKV
ncbi:hypothetical protein PoMZ_02262 [Pyricularia oryzae]|uniref:Uncharacterized protein n=1 Tax=Pyricularia oryzae TaxID=318829 RepID=A0A4P7N4B0_PYROR|nr:hypothetical protein PoMZ_02262 [Pyricularia oryzae]